MLKKLYISQILQVVLFISGVSIFSSCSKYLDNGTPPNSVDEERAFSDSASATSVVLGLYSVTANSTSNITSQLYNVCSYGAMSADEGFLLSNTTFEDYKNNTLSGGTSNSFLYTQSYQLILRANYCIINITGSDKLGESVKKQLLGEAKYWRAWHYFYLLNYFGGIPLSLNTDALNNSLLPRASAQQVYQQIVVDLTDAKSLLTVNYPSADRARINKNVVSAMLARVYFYMQNWTGAEAEATEVISGGTYSLENNLNNVFNKTSNEVILQAANTTGVTQFGVNFIPASTTPNFVLYDTLAGTFEPNDQRKLNWLRSIVFLGKTYFYPYKYKLRSGTTGNEFSVMHRLAELYLVRAEARANQNNVATAVDDLNLVRQRAGLNALPNSLSKDALLSALEHERWVELFTEYADRWLNLKRTGRADAVLSLIKPQWKPYQKLYPIPSFELGANPNMIQNEGY